MYVTENDYQPFAPTHPFPVGGTESLGITAGETRNPSRNMPRVVKLVFWRCVTLGIRDANSDVLCSIV